MFFIFKFLSGWIKSSWKSQAFNWDTLNRPLYGELATFHICVVNWVFFRVELRTFLFGLVGWLNSVLRFGVDFCFNILSGSLSFNSRPPLWKMLGEQPLLYNVYWLSEKQHVFSNWAQGNKNKSETMSKS